MSTTSLYSESLKRLLTSDSTPKLGLARIEALLCALGNPEKSFKSIHIAGTNGKGSTCAFTASLLQQTLPRVGLYTSPHLLCARERIQINRELVSEDLFCEAERIVHEAAERINEQPTFFERTTAMAFWIFAKELVDVAVIEVGLGGRLDSTNIITPLASVITRIDIDHCDFLGTSLEAIASEKAGIIKQEIPVVTGWQDERALEVIRSVALSSSAPLTEPNKPYAYELSLLGEHQTHNAALAVAAVDAAGISLSDDQIKRALAHTQWPARLELVQQEPPVLVDGAHNPNGMRALVHHLSKSVDPLVFVIGTTKGHDSDAMIKELLPIKGRITGIFATQSRSPRAEDPKQWVVKAEELAPSKAMRDVPQALDAAMQLANTCSGLTIVAGSLYVAGEARGLFFEMPIDPQLPNY